jgi:Chaperone of endosialidase
MSLKQYSSPINGSEPGGRPFTPAGFLRLGRSRNLQKSKQSGERKKNNMYPLIQLKLRSQLFVVTFLLACFGILDGTQAVITDPQSWFMHGNTGGGQTALWNLRGGSNNTALGLMALNGVLDGASNTAVGASALLANTANNNTATGASALSSNRIGADNTAIGYKALTNNSGGNFNTAIGSVALQNNTGSNNVGIGWDTLGGNTTGNSNTALGYGAGFANTTGTGNIALGAFSGEGVTTGFNVMCLGYGVLGANVDNSTWIGNVWGVTPQSGYTASVVVSDGGQLGVVASSQRFKKNIANMDTASETILSLRPVTFNYKSDAREVPQFGLVAEEVAKVNPALVVPDKDGKPFTVRYDAVNAMLLNEFLKEHRKVEKLEAVLRAVNERLTDQDAKIAKVSAQLELSKSAPQTVLNDR